MSSFRFEVIHTSTLSRARVGKIYTPHGEIDTPNFVAVGTNATLKALDSQRVEEIGLQLMFCNTYHLLLQPGVEIVAQAGGLHQFMGSKFPLITDSGGFQVFSLAYGSVSQELKGNKTANKENQVLKITDEGVWFRSYRDGKKILLTPESSIEAQKKLGADIIIPLDELPPYHTEERVLRRSLQRTHEWEERSLKAHQKNPQKQAIYGVIHGGVSLLFRKQSCQYLTSLPFDGYAIGGSVGKTQTEMIAMLRFTTEMLPSEKPIHLLGIGDLASLEKCVPLGIDTFDSSYPTKAARHGLLLTKQGGLKIEKKAFQTAFSPVEENCSCFTCRHYTLAYLHHLFKAKELSFFTLSTIHNLSYMVWKMGEFRRQILDNQV